MKGVPFGYAKALLARLTMDNHSLFASFTHISKNVLGSVHGKPFHPGLIVAVKARSLPKVPGAPLG